MTERVNLVDAYDNRSVIAKMVKMEERISGAETSVEASADAAASSASAAAASQTAAKTSETNAKASADTAAATLANTVDLSSKQTVTGAKTFAGDTTVTGSFVTSGNAEMTKLDIDTGKLTVGSGGSVEINGPLTASNPANVFQAANHDSALTSNDVLTAKDINEPNGVGNNLIHRSGNEFFYGIKTPSTPYDTILGCVFNVKNTSSDRYVPLFEIPPGDTSNNIGAVIISRDDTMPRFAKIVDTTTVISSSGWPGKIAKVQIGEKLYFACYLVINRSISGLVLPRIRSAGFAERCIGVNGEIDTTAMTILLEEA